jgi:hypothetical protein
MKIVFALLLASVPAVLTFAQDAATKATPAAAANPAPPAATVLPVSVAVVSAPFVLKDGAISQPAQTELAEGGKAIFTFTVAKAGDYVIHAVANAPDEDSNSFFLNIDAQPEDPLMIWDLEVTKGFEERVVSWRGGGDSSSDEIVPKIFKLSAGQHKLIIIGREPGQLKSVSIRPAAK